MAQASGAAQAITYEVRDLGAMADEIERGPFPYTGMVSSINEHGNVGGAVVESAERVAPTIWQVDGESIILPSGDYGGEVRALNGNGLAVGLQYGDVIGIKEGKSGGAEFLPAAWQDGEVIELAIPDGLPGDPAVLSGIALDVNDDGLIRGPLYDLASSDYQLLVWRSDGEIEHMLPFAEEGIARADISAINASGGVAGMVVRETELAGTTYLIPYPALWTEVEIEILDLPEDVPLPESATDSNPGLAMRGISDDGQLLIQVTTSTPDGLPGVQSYLSNDGAWTRLAAVDEDYPNVYARAIGPSGVVVGSAVSEDHSRQQFLVWEDGEPRALADALPDMAGLNISDLIAVTGAGDILAQARDSDDAVHGLVLTPA